MGYIMALDQGTTSCRCMLFDRRGRICSQAQEEFSQYYPAPGWVEHDPVEIWNCQLKTARQAMAALGITACEVAGIGITNQRETTVVWEKATGRPIYNAIVWQCRRTAEFVDSLVASDLSAMIQKKTGLLPDAYFSATKIRWILDHVDGAQKRAEQGELLFGTIDSWLIWNLTGGAVHVTDYTNASRTMIFNIHDLCWDEELLTLFQIPSNLLPSVRPSSCIYGTSDPALFGQSIPVCSAIGDQQSALFGQCCFSPGMVKNTYGTGCFLLMNTGEKAVQSHNGLITTIAVGLENRIEYALEGSIFIGGAVVQWLRDEMHLIDQSSDSEYFASKVKGTDGVYLVPAFTGLGAPYWNQYAQGCLVGMTRGTSKSQVIRAALEAVAYQTMDVCCAMERDAGISMSRLNVDGGASQNNFLLQFQSDILNVEICRPSCIETTALGAAYLAGLVIGYWNNKNEIQKNQNIDRIFRPTMEEADREKGKEGWRIAVECALKWGEQRQI